MGKIYAGQSMLRFRVLTGIDLANASQVNLKYKKPDGTEGSLECTIEDTESGVATYEVTAPSFLDQAGVWVFWSYVTFQDGRAAPGEPVPVKVYSEGRI